MGLILGRAECTHYINNFLSTRLEPGIWAACGQEVRNVCFSERRLKYVLHLLVNYHLQLAEDVIMLQLVSPRGVTHLPMSGLFYFPLHRHQVEEAMWGERNCSSLETAPGGFEPPGPSTESTTQPPPVHKSNVGHSNFRYVKFSKSYYLTIAFEQALCQVCWYNLLTV